MHVRHHLYPSCGAAALLGALGLALSAPGLWAQSCPPQTVTITCPGNNAGMGGVAPVTVIMSAPAPPGWEQGVVTCTIQDFSNPPKIIEQGASYVVNPTTYVYNCDTTLMNNGSYKIVVTTSLYNPVTQQTCNEQSTTTPTMVVQNPSFARLTCRQNLLQADVRDNVCTGSATSPLTGNQTFTVPVTAWDWKGTTVPFALTYNSNQVTDPQQPATPNFSGLSDRNSKWTHPFAQWLDYYYAADQAALYAVWHYGNQTLSFYFYEPVNLVGNYNRRLLPDDWNGRVSTITWTDTDGSAREIDRSVLSSSQDTLTFPGSVPVTYAYSGTDVAAVTDVSTGHEWQYTYDSYHNLKSARTPLETGVSPLVQYGYTYGSGSQIAQVVEQVLQADGTLNDPVTTVFNSFNLPTRITATAAAGSGHMNQTTQFHYDNDGPLTTGNLTSLVEAYGLPEQQTTLFSYNGTAGMWGLPDSVTNAVGGVSSFGYDTAGTDPSGRLLTAASPVNTIRGMGDPDYASSVTTLAYNADGLPSLVQDPMGHQVMVGYNAASAGSANLVITLTYPPYGNQRLITVDARGRVVQEQDEAGVVALWVYNDEDEVVSVTRAYGTPDAVTTTFHYDAQGDLDYFDPPSGSGGRVYFEYLTYNPDGTQPPNPPYQGQVTRIRYPDGTSEYFGYNNAAELAWRRKGDGTLVSIARDQLHRINSVSYPASGVSGPLSVTAQYDEFGRVDYTTDPRGSTTLAYDNLNRLMTVVPPAPQKEVDYAYLPDTVGHRWTTNARLIGVGGVPYGYQEDSKGRLFQLVSPFNHPATLQYDLDGKNLEIDFPNGAKEVRNYFEPQDLPAPVLFDPAGGGTHDYLTDWVTDASGVYERTGRVRREQDAAGHVHSYWYNKRYELNQESDPGYMAGTVTYGYDLNGNRTSRADGNGTDYYGVDANNKLLWVNHGTDSVPTSGQAGAYMLFSYDANGNMTHRERRVPDGTYQSFDLAWDGADNLAQIAVHGGPVIFSASYNGDGLRTIVKDSASGSYPTEHDFSGGLGGLLYDTYQSAVYTPGVSQRANGMDGYFHTDWLGSTRYLSDDTGNGYTGALRYDAFGNRTDATTPYDPTPLGPWTFGQGCLAFDARMFGRSEPGAGRVPQRDELRVRAGRCNLSGAPRRQT